MNDSDNNPTPEPTAPDNATAPSDPQAAPAGERQTAERRESRRWWTKLVLQPLLLLACGVVLIAALGVAQQFGLFPRDQAGGSGLASAGGESVRYICPMMCTPPQSEPGRCPVCAMELVPATSSGGNADSNSVQIDPAARRVANIRTVAVQSMPMSRMIRAIGELSYDEGTLKTISAYVDGRLDRLYADYTGVVVQAGDHLALVYSPRLYSSQVEFLLAKKSYENSRTATLERVVRSNRELYESARQRLIELGMTAPQIEQLEQAGVAHSRLHLCAPISGTVIEKLAVEGQYVKEGEAIYRLADLSTVWLMLELFPEDAAAIRYGQTVEAEVQSLPGRKFTGRVDFLDPNVNPKTRTVGVRVVIPNEENLLRTGDYAKATINASLVSDRQAEVGDSKPNVNGEVLVVPRSAVLMAGANSVVYVETEPGRFEIRPVVLGPGCGEQIVILSGVVKGEQVATRGNFLIDSQMQLAGNPSLIDPTKAQLKLDEGPSPEMIAALESLSSEDRALVEAQRTCPVADHPLGSMGTPPKVMVKGTPVFLCCLGCKQALLDEPDKYLAKLADQAAGETSSAAPAMDLPPIGVPQLMVPQPEIQQSEAPLEGVGTSPQNANRQEAIR